MATFYPLTTDGFLILRFDFNKYNLLPDIANKILYAGDLIAKILQTILSNFTQV